MNRWDCSAPGCTSSAVGVGGAAGLRAIGWYFEPPRSHADRHPATLESVIEGVRWALDHPPKLYCPRHYPFPIPCKDEFSVRDWNAHDRGDTQFSSDPDWAPDRCAQCAADQEAERIQAWIREQEAERHEQR